MEEVRRAKQAPQELMGCVELVWKKPRCIRRIQCLSEHFSLSSPGGIVWHEWKTGLPSNDIYLLIRYHSSQVCKKKKKKRVYPINSCNIVSRSLLEYINDFFSNRSPTISAEFNTIIDWPAALTWIMSESMWCSLRVRQRVTLVLDQETYRNHGTTSRRSTTLDRWAYQEDYQSGEASLGQGAVAMLLSGAAHRWYTRVRRWLGANQHARDPSKRQREGRDGPDFLYWVQALIATEWSRKSLWTWPLSHHSNKTGGNWQMRTTFDVPW